MDDRRLDLTEDSGSGFDASSCDADRDKGVVNEKEWTEFDEDEDVVLVFVEWGLLVVAEDLPNVVDDSRGPCVGECVPSAGVVNRDSRSSSRCSRLKGGIRQLLFLLLLLLVLLVLLPPSG